MCPAERNGAQVVGLERDREKMAAEAGKARGKGRSGGLRRVKEAFHQVRDAECGRRTAKAEARSKASRVPCVKCRTGVEVVLTIEAGSRLLKLFEKEVLDEAHVARRPQ